MWPFSTLRSQFVVVVSASVVLSNVGVIAIVENTRLHQMRTERLNAAAERIASVFRYFSSIPKSQRLTAVTALSGNLYRYSVSAIQPIGNHAMNDEESRIARHLESREPPHRFGSAIARVTRLYMPTFLDDRTSLEITQTISSSGESLLARFTAPPPQSLTPDILFAGAICTILTGVAAAWIAERVSRPLSSLAFAANEVAYGHAVPQLKSDGPKDFRRTADAFNTMSERVGRTLENHRRLLAAIGHDLRTPLAAMRISVEFVDDKIVRDRLIGNLDELQLLTEKLLSAAQSEQSRGSADRPAQVQTALVSLA
jgi:methyl-accepting chemotaxis protein